MISKVFDTPKGEVLYPERTICEVHREIYDLLVSELYEQNKPLFDKILPLLEEAFVLGIKTIQKLVEYKCSMPDWESKLPAEEVVRLRNLRIYLAGKMRSL